MRLPHSTVLRAILLRLLPILFLLLLLLRPARATGAAATALAAGKELKTTGQSKTQVLHLAAFLPYIYENRLAGAGNGLELVLVMALEAINANPSVLRDVELRIHASDTGCSKDTAPLAFLKQM